MTENSSEFRIKLEGIKLTKEVEQRIERGIQSVVMGELAAYKPNPDGDDSPGRGIIVIPRKWPGYWIKIFSEKDINGLGKDILNSGGFNG